ncbi:MULTISPECIES: imidazolonepropionase [Pacificibacter]|uniref:imidazolonepropionase n=1 Tax=Pacificibacter TaxID=1042323 RepID=UPI001C083020|nr:MULTISPECIES: imidazolonepropionase [Pacificibacter]MBU2936384.1 imidazolonepropionase [Pacificibacter marinus]MDO6616575.1 imidazolonepropionase [Pacificibacter sp. 1_MG-2023]
MTQDTQVFVNLNLTTMGESDAAYGWIEDGAIVVTGGMIDWLGPVDDLPNTYKNLPSTDLGGRVVTPGLIDCHTHVVHGGDRAVEFEMRLNGASYEEVARAGGGIISTVKATRGASEQELLASALRRVDVFIAEGVTTIEVKSGYGLDVETELRMLRVARAIADHRPIRVKTTFLGAHATPAEFAGRDDAYIDEICIPTLRAAHAEGLVDAVDGFCEGIAFQPAQIARVFNVAQQLGLPVKLHAEQLSNIGGAKLAAKFGALSADHIEYLDEDGVKAMAQAGTVAVILPGAFYTLRETQAPPIDLLRKHGVPMALATDLNPGTAPINSLLLTLNMGCTLFRMTPEEALRGATQNAARALGLTDVGTLAVGKRADMAVWDIKHPAELAYRIGFNPLYSRIFGGTS